MISEKTEAAGGLLLGTALEGKREGGGHPRILETYFWSRGRGRKIDRWLGRALRAPLVRHPLALDIFIGMAKRVFTLILRASFVHICVIKAVLMEGLPLRRSNTETLSTPRNVGRCMTSW